MEILETANPKKNGQAKLGTHLPLCLDGLQKSGRRITKANKPEFSCYSEGS